MRLVSALLALSVAGAAAAAPAPPKTVKPYWLSIEAGEARMRTGPDRRYPVTWLYKRRGLPLKVVQTTPGWRRVRDQDGAEGWMLGSLLSETRTGVVLGARRPLRAAPSPEGRVLWQAEPGVVGHLSECAGGWCALEVAGRRGYIEAAHLWGVDPGEVVE